ncbi:MAG: disulfide oxidoreductase [Desulfuromonas sp.]|nr:MAG: disulfide oxidoreductase [Desulfuromonas sp.]
MITRDMKIEEIIRKHPATVAVFEEFGLACGACQVAAYEDLQHGAAVHKVDIEELINKLNAALD